MIKSLHEIPKQVRNDIKNVYIHIPFCKSKCHYCSFVSYPKPEMKEQYLNALEKEIKVTYKGEKLNTLYCGGGTPSILTVEDFSRIINLFNTHNVILSNSEESQKFCDPSHSFRMTNYFNNTEITTELNPETITQKYLEDLKKTGINRLSFGCQTFDDNILKLIGRRHNSSNVENAVKYAQNAGFDNISLDFIYGLPTQTIESFENDLKHAISLGVKHISLYGLKIDEDCYFYKHPPKDLPDEDIQADMYLKAIETLKDFEHYEISNFSKKGYNSRHNLNYWDNNSYYGFGCAAHGYENGTRYFNTSSLEDYIKNPTDNKTAHKLTEQEQLEEEIFLGFRKISGINVENINKKFSINFREKYAQTLDKYVSYKYLAETNTGFKLTTDGILISNVILSEFLV